MLEIIAKIGLFFSQPLLMACVIFVGFLLLSEKAFGRTLFLLLFTMIYNVYLKSIWQMPLPPPLEGWAFPSGHMHGAVVFWGWLAIEYRKIWYAELTFFMLCLTGYGIVYHGFHYPIDILGACGFGILSLLVYTFLHRLSFFKEHPYRLGYLLAILGIIFIALLPPEMRKPHQWQALGTLIGFSLGWALLQKHRHFAFARWQQLLLIFLAAGGSFAIAVLINKLPIPANNLIFVKFFGVGLWVSSCKIILAKCLNRFKTQFRA